MSAPIMSSKKSLCRCCGNWRKAASVANGVCDICYNKSELLRLHRTRAGGGQKTNRLGPKEQPDHFK